MSKLIYILIHLIELTVLLIYLCALIFAILDKKEKINLTTYYYLGEFIFYMTLLLSILSVSSMVI